MIDPPPSPLSSLLHTASTPICNYWKKLTWGYPVLYFFPRANAIFLRFVNTAIESANTDKDLATLNLGNYPMVVERFGAMGIHIPDFNYQITCGASWSYELRFPTTE
jgi:hypothetical protein